MIRSIVGFIFFANYFVGGLAVALSLETAFQLGLPLNPFWYYLLVFVATVLYYTHAYWVPAGNQVTDNPRTEWYRTHHSFVRYSRAVLWVAFLVLAGIFLCYDFGKIGSLPIRYWLALGLVPLAALLYYGLLPSAIGRYNLRNTGWMKAFVIGFVWAGCVNLFPVAMVKLHDGIEIREPAFLIWLFIKNWMFCTVNAIMFDIKDYEDDSNIQLKTFVVQMGLKNTIFYVLIPLLLVGLASFLTFAAYRQIGPVTVLFNMVPFICLLAVAFALQRPRNILYYLVVIDGLLLIKAICGIAGSFFAHILQ
ncbi:UbiA family prenyltransferase [Dyadobacter sandarakinus]|uniref:UbiA family prenyltransferase n=1 Tax=Dyadobacter sandarakinus TaxID=2747268 RepID=A0ABX7IE13_9BACT|nr:UbiA family prenyltransferase [Dyadobacter sandarakinus]QRR03657.1 UbiA family prenyltransferase [Dyadobacter sandarakinus]